MQNYGSTSTPHSNVLGHAEVTKRRSPLVAVIQTYQRFTSGRPSPCRFYPSCSNYAIEAIETHGNGRGVLLALRRLSRCRPLGPHGVDLVPTAAQTRSLEH